jgi:hypothetical protein
MISVDAIMVFSSILGLVWVEEYWHVFRLNPRHGEDSFPFLNYDSGLNEDTLQYSYLNKALDPSGLEWIELE